MNWYKSNEKERMKCKGWRLHPRCKRGRVKKVSLSIHNHLGQLVYQTEEPQPQGQQQLIWNAEGYSDGIYYYRLQVGDAIANGKMVKVR